MLVQISSKWLPCSLLVLLVGHHNLEKSSRRWFTGPGKCPTRSRNYFFRFFGTVGSMFILSWRAVILVITYYYRAAGALPQSAEDTIGRNPCVQAIPPSTIHYAVQCKIQSCCRHTIFFKFKIWHDIGSFGNRKISDIAYPTDLPVRSGAD